MERELAILPTRQTRVEATLKMRANMETLTGYTDELNKLELARKKLFVQYSTVRSQVIRYTAESEGRDPPAWTLGQGEAKTERAKFIMKCPSSECRGFLSTAYKCGTCQMWACPDCLVMKGEEKDAAHTCDPGQKESVALIIKESKGCPKCGQRISKIDGCFAAGVEILLWNGGTKMSQDIVVGDELVGDDGQIRVVQDVCTGEDELYEVTQTRGMSYTVNSKHTLALKRGEVYVDIIIDDYMKLSEKEQDMLLGYKIDKTTTSISVKPIGRGVYYGWNVGENHRFASKDVTVLKNCDQMWCPDCHTAFSWVTGQIVNGVIHNPHYYEFLRKENNGVAPRNIGDVPCGGIPGYTRIHRLVRPTSSETSSVSAENGRAIMAIHRIASEIQDQRIRNYQGRFTENDNGDLGVRYLMKEISKEDMKAELAKREMKRNKHAAIRAVLEMFVNTSIILLNALCDTSENDDIIERVRVCLESFANLRKYVNDTLMNISRMKQCSVPQITAAWHWSAFNKVTPKPRKGAVVAPAAEADAEDA
jgi:hypothetical protein